MKSRTGSPSKRVHIRSVTMADASQLLEWVNSPDSLKWKRLTSDKTSKEAHERWLAKQLSDPESFIWAIEYEGRPVGQVRLQRRGSAFIVDIFIAACDRHRGFASSAVEAAIAEMRRSHPGSDVLAEVHENNLASRRLFELIGFRLAGREDDWRQYWLLAGDTVKATST
jgi:RimJ/RimL family protein N-acetyltransferase